MIFVTVGGQLPFDRLVRAVDEWAGARGRTDAFAQIGRGAYRPRHLEWTELLGPAEFAQRARAASCIVAHAGMGTILTALEHGKPLVILPRRAALHEQRNDHQLATAERFRGRAGVRVALDERELAQALDELGELAPGERIGARASDELLARLRAFAAGVQRRRGP